MSGSKDGNADMPSANRKSRQAPGKADSVGRVLRTVYDDTLREEVPDEFKDLLRKLK